MCKTKFSLHPKCKHWSVEITDTCAEDRNFDNCPAFQDGNAKALNPRSHPREKAEEGNCPKCNKEDEYDGEKIRMVKGVQHGGRIGFGYHETDFGVDCLNNRGLTKKKTETELQALVDRLGRISVSGVQEMFAVSSCENPEHGSDC